MLTRGKRAELSRKVAHYQRMSARHAASARALARIPEWQNTAIHHQHWAAEYHRAAFGYLLRLLPTHKE